MSWKIDFIRSKRVVGLACALLGCLTLSIAAWAGARGSATEGTLQAAPFVVLTGSYQCDVRSYVAIVPPGTEPPEPFVETSHSVSLGGTGATVAMAPVGPIGVGPGFGGRQVVGALQPAPVNLGSGIAVGFNGGTLSDCARFGEAVLSAARGLGCVVSPVRTLDAAPPYYPNTQGVRFSFVCEGAAEDELRAIGEIDRVVATQQLGTAP